MAQTKFVKDAKTDIHKIDARKLVVKKGLNPREDYGDIEHLALSILEHGVQQPLTVVRVKGDDGEDRFQVIDGHRRYMAIQYIFENYDIDTETLIVPVIVKKPMSDDNALVLMVVSNDKKSFTPLEMANVIMRLKNAGFENENIQSKLGISKTTISFAESVYNAPEKIKKMIRQGVVSFRIVADLLSRFKMDYDKVISVIEEGLSGVDEEIKTGEKNTKSARNLSKRINSSLNSINQVKNIIKVADEKKLRLNPDMKHIYDVIKRIFSEKIPKEEIAKIFFLDPIPPTQSEKKRQEKSEKNKQTDIVSQSEEIEQQDQD